MKYTELEPNKARRTQEVSKLEFDSTDDLPILTEIIGQDRGLDAISFGVAVNRRGYNIYVTGPTGTGKKTAITKYLHEISKNMPTPYDWCYIHNFKDPRKPKALELPKGKGAELENNMNWFINQARESLKKAFQSKEHSTMLDKIESNIQDENLKILGEMERLSIEQGFAFIRSPTGITLIPVLNGQQLSDDEYNDLPFETIKTISSRRSILQDELKTYFLKLVELEKKKNESIEELNRQIATFALEPLIQMLGDLYANISALKMFFQDVKNDILTNVTLILNDEIAEGLLDDIWNRYKVNLLIDNSATEGAPVIMVPHPTYNHLFGYIEKEFSMGYLSTDFKLIRPGSAHAANGGFLVIEVEDMISNPYSWPSLKRMIKEGTIEIEDTPEPMEYITTNVLMPEPMHFNGKVILFGDRNTLYNISQTDPDFKELFKVKADFDDEIDWSNDSVSKYSRFIGTLCKRNNLKPLDRSAVAAIIEYCSRLAEDQLKLSTKFGKITDFIYEVDFYASLDGSPVCLKKHVEKALEKRIYRSNLYQEKYNEMINRGMFLIDVQGEKVGQINGLAVLSQGDYSYGQPNRVTATVGVGRKGIIDIERESQLGGPLHTKGVHILSGYLSEMYSQLVPLSLTARLVLEQSYSGVDGDSASSTELYAILSALANVPIKQNIAITGSLNQMGQVQAIGSVNEKIEGFYEICKMKGLAGDQGVMIPESNIENLMLKEEIIDAMKQGLFHIYPVNHIRDGVEILTGIKFGEKISKGQYEENSINWLVQKRLNEFAESIREYDN